MQVPQLFDAFVFRPNIEIVKTFLPDVLRGVIGKAARRGIPSPGLRQYAARESEF